MITVGILTLSASDNCGSLLQAYALQEILRKRFNCCAEIIRYKTVQSTEIYALFPRSFYRHPKKTLFTIRHLSSIVKQKQGYQLFRNTYLQQTAKTYRSVEELESVVDRYDVLITGSDQVWNVYMADYSDAFYLPWKTTHAKKVAYAASLGSALVIDPEKAAELSCWLSDFYRISVREQSGKTTLENITKHKIQLTADPTLLLTKAEWDSVAGAPLVEGPYIFFYSWAYPDEQMNRIVQQFSRETKLDVYVINSSRWYKYRPEQFNFILYKESGPSVFLNLMKYARYVFVQSFHGAVFANIFQKRFFFLNENCDGRVDFRSDSLFKLLQEEKQVVHEYADLQAALSADLTFTSSGLDQLVQTSLDFLKEAIET